MKLVWLPLVMSPCLLWWIMTWLCPNTALYKCEVPLPVLHHPVISELLRGRRARQHSPHGDGELMLGWEKSFCTNLMLIGPSRPEHQCIRLQSWNRSYQRNHNQTSKQWCHQSRFSLFPCSLPVLRWSIQDRIFKKIMACYMAKPASPFLQLFMTGMSCSWLPELCLFIPEHFKSQTVRDVILGPSMWIPTIM